MTNIIKSNLDLSSKRTFLPLEEYLPEWALNTEFFNAIIILLNYLEDSIKDISNEKYAMIADFYKDIYFKYKNIDLLTEDSIKQIIKEQGYGLIVETLDLDLEKLKVILVYLPLFKILKSTDEGYRLLLSLVSYDFEIETWLDNPVDLDTYTYNITYITFLNTGFDASIVKNFVKLSRFYVYPVLKSIIIKVIYRDNQPFVHGLSIIKKNLKCKCHTDILLTLTIEPTPIDAIVTFTSDNGTQYGNSIIVIAGSTVNYTVSAFGYETKTDSIVVKSSETISVELEHVYATLTVETIPENATVVLTSEGSTQEGNSITVTVGSIVTYTVSAENYETQTNSIYVTSNRTISIELQPN